jgi:hypothetical protein
MRRLVALWLCAFATAGQAQEIDRSPRPLPNPALYGVPAAVTAAPGAAAAAASPAAPAAPAGGGLAQSPRPLPNPALYGVPVAVTAMAAPVTDVAASEPSAAEPPAIPGGAGLARSPRPLPRPRLLTERIAALKAAPAAAGLDLSSSARPEVELAADAPPSRKERRKKRREAATMEGAVCGVPAIKGQEIAPITSKVQGCGVADPVAVTSIAGVRLSQTATVDCSIAKALNAWVDEVAQPAFDGKLVELQVAAHYVCRNRNNKKGGKISEHGKGRAIDISAFILSDGKVLTVRQDYNRLLRRIYKAGCGYFRTTLGPGSDGHHEDHFHFDTSARSGGAYCR